MAHISIFMPESGEAGVIVATRDDGVRVEFRGNPYHLWTADEDTPIAYFSPSWTAFQADRGRDFSVIVDGVSG